jgi:hypothetical protein
MKKMLIFALLIGASASADSAKFYNRSFVDTQTTPTTSQSEQQSSLYNDEYSKSEPIILHDGQNNKYAEVQLVDNGYRAFTYDICVTYANGNHECRPARAISTAGSAFISETQGKAWYDGKEIVVYTTKNRLTAIAPVTAQCKIAMPTAKEGKLVGAYNNPRYHEALGTYIIATPNSARNCFIIQPKNKAIYKATQVSRELSTKAGI